MAKQYIEQLGYFVNRSFTDELADRCKALVIGKKISLSVAGIAHCSEFYHGEYVTVFARSGLSEPYFTIINNIQQRNSRQKYWSSEQEYQQRAEFIKEWFDHSEVQSWEIMHKSRQLSGNLIAGFHYRGGAEDAEMTQRNTGK